MNPEWIVSIKQVCLHQIDVNITEELSSVCFLSIKKYSEAISLYNNGQKEIEVSNFSFWPEWK